jgi:hypothetical protein
VSETTFTPFLELEKRKEDKQKINYNKSVVDQIKENETNERKAKSKKKKTISPNDSPKSNKPLNFESIAKEVCIEFTITYCLSFILIFTSLKTS